MPVSAGRFYFSLMPLPAGLAEDRDTLRADLSRYFAGWAPPVQKLIAALDPQTTNRIEIHDIEPFSRLVRGRVALSRRCRTQHHPGYWPGGCAAMEDAVVLGAVFRQTRDIAAALREYEAQRCDRVRDLVLKARKGAILPTGRICSSPKPGTRSCARDRGAHYQRHVRHHPQRAAGLTVAMDSITALSV